MSASWRKPSRLWFAGAVAALALTSPLRGQAQPEAAPVPLLDVPPPISAGQAETLDYRTEDHDRMVVPIRIGANGPYNFIVDTGAERTVLSSELAARLALGPGRPVTIHSMTEVSRVSTVIVPGLRVGQRTVADIHAPIFGRATLGAAGVLGVDTLQSQRVIFDFERQEMTIMPSRRMQPRWPEGEIVVTARSRFGRLMLVDASMDGQRVYIILDTGSEVTIGNTALRDALARRRRLGPTAPVELVSVTGGRFTADYSFARRIRIGTADINNLPIAFADVHPFARLGLLNRPAILLGMDALRLFDRVSIDFSNRRVRMLLPEGSNALPDVRMASARATRLAN